MTENLGQQSLRQRSDQNCSGFRPCTVFSPEVFPSEGASRELQLGLGFCTPELCSPLVVGDADAIVGLPAVLTG